ncbi:MAG TPA: endonuclease/exonuclease/phosphatase family protein [Fodinibius sp.]|nr:endonuclease/exonuclease/phosphatase family protein [Fodinibius sp.]
MALSIGNLEGYAQSESSDLKVITYNIWNGFKKQPRYGNTDTSRAEKLVKWAKKQEADVIALQELVEYDTDKLYQLGQRMGLSNTILLKNSGHPVGITSKHPIELIERKMEGMHHGFLHVKIQGIHFFVVHLSPNDHKTRRKEASAITGKIMREVPAGEWVIVLGDFNARSPHDESFLQDQNVDSESEGQEPDSRVMKTFMDAGLNDLVYRQDPSGYHKISFPTPALSPGREWRNRGYRIDYILATSELADQCISATIPYSKLTKQISDHFPVVAEFKLPTINH